MAGAPDRTARLRYASCNVGHSGPWLENTCRDHFSALFAAGEDVGDRIYLPIRWFDCIFGCSKEQKADLRGASVRAGVGRVYDRAFRVNKRGGTKRAPLITEDADCMVAAGYLKRLRPEYKYVTVYTMVRPAQPAHCHHAAAGAAWPFHLQHFWQLFCRNNHRSGPPSLLRLTESRPCTPQDKGMVFSALDFPLGLDLLVFSQGATMRGLRTVPLPILKKVGRRPLEAVSSGT